MGQPSYRAKSDPGTAAMRKPQNAEHACEPPVSTEKTLRQEGSGGRPGLTRLAVRYRPTRHRLGPSQAVTWGQVNLTLSYGQARPALPVPNDVQRRGDRGTPAPVHRLASRPVGVVRPRLGQVPRPLSNSSPRSAGGDQRIASAKPACASSGRKTSTSSVSPSAL